MDEYNEAIQRLETQERVPSLPIHRTYFPIPRKDTPRNYDFVFRTTGNTNIPKYSIPMNCIIENVEYEAVDDGLGNDFGKWTPKEQKTVFSFELDPTFITTQGYRKSIAVRRINIERDFTDDTNSYFDSGVRFVASSINPWSQKNIIGSPEEIFHNIPRLFPWNGAKHIDIWFLNHEGKVVDNPIVSGYLELELIIDNENTYALDE